MGQAQLIPNADGTPAGCAGPVTQRVSGDPKPTVGRIVHFVAYGALDREYPAGSHRAAIITGLRPGAPHPHTVSLAVLNPTGLTFEPGASYDPTGVRAGTWHWPERE